MGWLSAAIGGFASLVGGERANKSAEASAERQIAFQRESAQNAYQWATADMKKAGINPMLAYQRGGSSALSGASYKPQDTLTPAVNSALAARRQAADLKLVKEQTKNTQQDTVKKRQEGYAVDTNAALNTMRYRLGKEELHSAKATAAAAKTDEKFFSTDMGKFLRKIDMIGRSLNPFANSAKSVRGATR